MDSSNIVERDICRSGFAIDGRGFTALWIEQAAANTKYLMEHSKLRPIVRPSHDEPGDYLEEAAYGEIVDLWVEPDPEGSTEVILRAKMQLSEKALSAYKQGEYPSVSIGADYCAYTPDGRLLGHYIEHVMIAGNTPVAFPNLRMSKGSKMDDEKGLLNRMYTQLRGYFSKMGLDKPGDSGQMADIKAEKNEENMETDEKNPAHDKMVGLIDQCQSALAALAEYIQSGREEQDEGEMPSDAVKAEKSDDDDEQNPSKVETADDYAKREGALLAKEIDFEIKRLQIPHDLRGDFRDVAAKMSLKKAIEMYSKMHFGKPASGEKLPHNQNVVQSGRVSDATIRQFSSAGVDLNPDAARQRLNSRLGVNIVPPLPPALTLPNKGDR